MSKLTLVLDSSYIQSFSECPQMAHYSYGMRLAPVDRALDEKSDAATQGSYGHKLLERFYKIKNNYSITDAMEFAMSVKADEICECGHDLVDHIEIETLEGIKHKCTGQNEVPCKCETPKASKVEITPEEKKLVGTRFREYVFTYIQNDFQIETPHHAEVGFSYKLYEDHEYLFILEGKIDLFNPTYGTYKLGYADHKFQLRRRDLYTKSIQFRNYGLVTNAKLAMINYVRLTQKVDTTTYKRQLISFAPGEHEWWRKRLIKYFLKVAEQRYQINALGPHWVEKNWGSCSGKFGYECDYTQLCNERDHAVKLAVEKNLYQIKPEWKPW